MPYLPKHRRDSSQLESTVSILDYETETVTYDENPTYEKVPLVEDLPEITSSSQPTSHFNIIDKPKETVLNFYDNPNVFVTASDMKDEEKLSLSTFKGLMKQANGFVVSNEDRKNVEYSTVMVTEEKPTFEDKESMLIANCNVDADCGINAVCFHVDRTQKFCKCLPHYKGNGMFCWMF